MHPMSASRRRPSYDDGTSRTAYLSVGKSCTSIFARGLELAPSLRFELIDVLFGVDGMTVVYRRETGTLVADIVIFRLQEKPKDKPQKKVVRVLRKDLLPRLQ